MQFRSMQKLQDNWSDVHDPEHALRTMAGRATVEVCTVDIIDGLLDCNQI